MGLRDRLSYRGVTAFYGMPGSGKTYGLAEVGLREMAAGREVWSNGGFDLAGSKIFNSFDDFMAIPNGATVVWDELPLYVNSRKWAEFPDGLLYRLTQIRKDGLRLYYSTIDPAMVDTNVRRVTFWWWECHSLTSRLMRRALWPHESFRKRDARPHRRELVRVKGAVAEAYDTMGKVAVEQSITKISEKRSGSWSLGAPGVPPKAGTANQPQERALRGAVRRQIRQGPEPGPQRVPGPSAGVRGALRSVEDPDGLGHRRPEGVPLRPAQTQRASGGVGRRVHGSGGTGPV